MIHDGAPRTIYVMGRAPNSGAPQRVSAHVVPKATASSPFSVAAGTGDDEEEKTTIESGWEEEPSTTVEQGEVADRIRALGVNPERRNTTNVTSTNGAMLDELTVDDQHANAAISMITPPMLQVRLVVTGGNDAGQEIAVLPGKTYTIGRAVENDIVLTDIAVSRKHFDLRHEAGAWVLVDRGSGNGTLVNGNLEDHPFMLANGDAIEIGNTTFRFELPNGAPRPQSSFDSSMDEPIERQHQRQQNDDDDEDEPSTVACKPVRTDELATPSHVPARSQPMQARQEPRAKTMPPPAPLRPRSPSVQPAYQPPHQQAPHHLGPMPGMSAAMTHQMGGPMPATTLPMPQQQNNGRPMGAQAPTMLGDSMGISMQGNMHGPGPMQGQMPGMLPSTIPGQAPPMGSQPQMYNSYPGNGQPQPQPNMAQMLVINGMPPGRDATSTALVPPTPYGGMPVMVPQQPAYVAPTIPRKTKLILGGAGLTLFAAIATVAIIKGAGGGGAKPGPDKGSATTTTTTTKQSVNDSTKKDTPKSEPKVTPIVTPTKTAPVVTPTKTDPPKTESKLATALKADLPKVEPTTPTVAPKVDPKIAVVPPPKVEAPKIAVVPPPKVETPKIAVVPPPKVETPKVEPKKKDPKKREPRKKEPTKVVKKEPPPPKEEAPDETPVVKKEPKRVAMGDTDGLRSKADALYKAKKFSDAANVMMAGSKSSADPEQAKDLRLKAGYYASFGKNYNIGMAQATSAKDAWTALTAARTFDNSLGGNYTSEINKRMGQVAPKAAVAFMAVRDYTKAKQAVGLAESSGNNNSTAQGVRSSLEQRAGELYREAQTLQTSDPAAATSKFREIQRMVDSTSPWHQKAGKALTAMKG